MSRIEITRMKLNETMKRPKKIKKNETNLILREHGQNQKSQYKHSLMYR